jgi:hypothetical protein
MGTDPVRMDDSELSTMFDKSTHLFGRSVKILKFCIWMPILYSCETATEGL